MHSPDLSGPSVDLTQEQQEAVRAATREATAHEHPLLAAILGGIVTRLISPLKLRQFGGFVPFMNRYLRDLIEVDPSTPALQGQLWLRRTQSDSAASPTWRNVETLDGALFWRSFANPKNEAQFAVDPEDHTVYVAQFPAALRPNNVAIAKLTNADYVRAAETLIDQLPATVQQGARDTLSGAGANWRWMNLLKQETPHLLAAWHALRAETVFRRLTEQLTELAFPPQKIVDIERLLKNAHAENATLRAVEVRQNKIIGGSATMATFDVPSADDLHKLREIAQLAVRRMNEQELRSLRVPLAVVMDALKHMRR